MSQSGRLRYLRLVSIGLLFVTVQVMAQRKELLTPQSCTSLRYLATDATSWKPALQESPDKAQVAYVVQVPNVATNANDVALYVRRLGVSEADDQEPVLINRRIAGIRWLPDSRYIVALVENRGKGILTRIDTKTRSTDTISDPSEDIADYSMDRTGEVFAVSARIETPEVNGATTSAEMAEGYRIKPAPSRSVGARPRREVHLIRKTPGGRWVTEGRLEFRSPLTGEMISSLGFGGGIEISLSPNGRYLLLDSLESPDGLPQSWYSDPYGSFMIKNAGYVIVTYLYNVVTRAATVPIETPIQRQEPVWSPDSNAYARVSLPPIGSKWVKEDMEKDVASYRNTHMFTVRLASGKVDEVVHRIELQPLAWTDAEQLILRTSDGLIRTFKWNVEKWEEQSAFRIPLPGLPFDGPLISDGTHFFGSYENASTAPELFSYTKDSKDLTVLAKLDPEVEHFVLPKAEPIHWTTSNGYRADGVLLLPPDYRPAQRYPLVIENGSFLYNGEFVCDSGVKHVSSFARGILADQGILYLMRTWPDIEHPERDYYPRGYPGQFAEAAFRLDLVESAIKYLDSRRMVDLSKIGILGFSRGGWYTEYALSHSTLHFRAASVTDNVEYTLGPYWYDHLPSYMQEYEALYGGPPYGKTLQHWLDYSISFNADKIHTPLLKEVMGYGLEDNDPNRLPGNLAAHYELFTALERLKTPVEMYYYPREEHQVAHPVARIASLQRNIDWFRFWLQGYERRNPEDPDEYARWEHLRDQFEHLRGQQAGGIR